jgi:hypothetical protein
MLRALFVSKPQFEWRTAEGVRQIIDDLDVAVTALTAEIPEKAHQDLRAWLGEQANYWDAALAMTRDYHAEKSRWDGKLVAEAALEPRTVLGTLVERASAHLLGLRPWFRLGAAVGRYELVVQELDPFSAPWSLLQRSRGHS